MIISALIRQQVGMMFKFVEPHNRYRVLRAWKDSNQVAKTHVAFQNCVSCNIPRTEINLEKPELIRLDADSYFCFNCLQKIADLQKKYYSLGPAEATYFDHECNEHFFKDRSNQEVNSLYFRGPKNLG